MLLLPLTLALDGTDQDLVLQLNALLETNQGHTISGFSAKLLANQNIQVHIQIEDAQEILVGMVTTGTAYTSLTLGELADPTIDVYVAKEVFLEWAQATAQEKFFQAALKEKKITYRAHGLFNKIRLFFLVQLTLPKVESEAPENITQNEVQENVTQNRSTSPLSPTSEAVENVSVVVEDTEVVIPEQNISAVPKTIPAEPTAKSHTVLLIGGGFEIREVRIKAGDTVIWKNEREGRYSKALVLGTKACAKLKSSFFGPGELFRWKFEAPGECVVVDGIYTTQTMKVIVE